LVRPYRVHVEILSLKEPAEERRRFIRDADNLVRCLTIEFEIKLGLGSTVVPVGKKSELAPPHAPRVSITIRRTARAKRRAASQIQPWCGKRRASR